MTTQVEMKGRICPIMSSMPVDPFFVHCQGDLCVAFNSRPTYIYLAKDGKSFTLDFRERKSLTDLSQDSVPESARKGLRDDIEEINSLVAQGWERQGRARGIVFRKPGEPDCRCDAMPANMECQGGGG